MRYFLPILYILICLTACRQEDPAPPVPVPPQYDTTYITIYDTIVHPTERIDTVAVDTLIRDTIINIDNNLVVVGYCAYYGNKLPDPLYLTHLIYSSAELSVVNNVYKSILLFDPASKKREQRFKSMLNLKKRNPNLKVMVSIAHVCDISNNKQGGSFSALSKDPTQRRQFAHDCRALCDEWGLDGIDINWELPGMSQSGAACDSMVDVDNFTLLMKDLRDSLGPNLYLTYAGHTRQKEKYGNGYRFMDNAAVYPYIDWINVMCYGMGVAPAPHNAIASSEANTSCWKVFRNYEAAGFKMDKFVMGVPFYTHSPYVKGEWYYESIITMAERNPSVYKIKRNTNTWMVPYCLKNGEMVGSFDDPISLAYKGEWIQKRGMHGIMWWDTNGDDSKHSLQKAVWKALKTQTLTDTSYTFFTDTVRGMDTVIISYPDTIITPKTQQ